MEKHSSYVCIGCGQAPDIEATFRVIQSVVADIQGTDNDIKEAIKRCRTSGDQYYIASRVIQKNDLLEHLAHLIHDVLPGEIGVMLGADLIPPAPSGHKESQQTAPVPAD